MSERSRTKHTFDALEALLQDKRIPEILAVAFNKVLDEILSNERYSETTDAEYFMYQLLVHYLAGAPMSAEAMFPYIGGDQEKIQAVRNLKDRFDHRLRSITSTITIERAPLAYQIVIHE